MSFTTGGTCVLAWKRKDGIGGRMSRVKWEQRWFFMADGQILYYCMGDEDRFGEDDYEPRGRIDLTTTKCRVEVAPPSPDAPTPNEVEISSEEIVRPNNSTRVSTEKPKKPVVTKWRLCFDSQVALVEFLEKAHAVLTETGHLKEKDTERFEHEFQAGDHIYRWEMIVCPPVIYPIQIHGIVLEAGRNCVVVADFGLTGYGKKNEEEDFHHASETDKEQHNKIVLQFKKLRPNSDQRLHISTLTDPMDIRKWTKAHYDENTLQNPNKLRKLTKLLKRVKLTKSGGATAKNNNKDEQQAVQSSKSTDTMEKDNSSEYNSEDNELETNHTNSDDNEEEQEQQQDDSNNTGSVRNRAASEDYAKQRQEEHPLPKADPKEIVLSRANFLLEYGEEKLPPYHVFYSNSECIAVWCKTGRWSTLQTAVFLSSNAIGGAKSATVATLGVAAAHAILAPVVAVGGLLWVSAPMVILQKSRKQWEENTKLMTDLYWQWAPSKVFVCAIESWSELGYTTQQARKERKQKEKEEAEAKAKAEEAEKNRKKYTTEEIMAGKRLDHDELTDAIGELEKECKVEHEPVVDDLPVETLPVAETLSFEGD